ncbi:MAG: DUF3078 domain-containing protein [Fibrobacter sp.]|jgi:hypothetical protein|nr:DUF3078 domain-containing protein [Fibrobacter sp.]
MKKILCLLLISITGVFAANGMFSSALPENWIADVVASVKYSRNTYDNWTAGGTNTNSWQFHYDADVTGKWDIFNWRNVLNLAWGQTYTANLGTRKSVDKIFFESDLDYNHFEPFKPYLGVRFESQFTTGYKYYDSIAVPYHVARSDFMDPGYFTQFIGIGYIPNDNFSQRIAFANRMIFSDKYGAADDKKTAKVEKFKNEPGIESTTEYKVSLFSILTFKTRLWGFTNFKGRKEIDGKWENGLSVTILPLLELSASVDIAYDKDTNKDHQYRDAVNLGITWRWF